MKYLCNVAVLNLCLILGVVSQVEAQSKSKPAEKFKGPCVSDLCKYINIKNKWNSEKLDSSHPSASAVTVGFDDDGRMIILGGTLFWKGSEYNLENLDPVEGKERVSNRPVMRAGKRVPPMPIFNIECAKMPLENADQSYSIWFHIGTRQVEVDTLGRHTDG